MSYSRYKMMEKFVNGIPTGEFTQGDLIQAGPFDTYDECNEGNSSPGVTPDNPGMLYRWIASNEPWCDGTDEYKTEKQQQSSDFGKSWSDTGATRKGEFVQSYSFTCGFVAERWVEVRPNIDFICENGNKFYLQKKEISTDGVNWTDSGDTRKGPLIEANSADCGYPQTRWVEIPLNVDYVCVGEDKYYKEKEQITNDGIVWQDTGNTRRGRVAEVHSTDCGYEPPTTVTRWIVVEDEFICQGTDRYQKEKEQISEDSGQTWTDTGNVRAGSLIEKNSYSCGYVSFRWVDVPGEYVCQGYDKYQKQMEEKTTDGKLWTPTGRTRTGALIEKNSYSCGYVSFRWVTVSGEFVCSGTDKYTKEKEQSSTDGSVWKDTGRERAGSLIEKNSYSCGYVSFRWVDAPNEFVCQGYDKYAKQNEEKTTDGQTWTPTGRTRTGALIEKNSYSCGYVSFRWVTVENEYVCQGYDRYTKEKEQSSTDGSVWQDTGRERAGSLIERDSSYCKEPPTPVKSDYLTFTALEDATFRFSGYGLYHSTDKKNWTAHTASVTIAAGNKVYFKGEMYGVSNAGIGTFSSTGNFTASGTPMSLLFGDDFDGQTRLGNYAFLELFKNCTKLTSIDGLVVTATNSNLAYECCYQMFYGCTGLTSVPSTLLPATTLANECYDSMFMHCTGLTSIPSTLLPATTLAWSCYQSMFYGCTGLTSIPSDLLPVTTLADDCYKWMFSGCTGLTNVPNLPATTLEDSCYQEMFKGCTSLTSIPSTLLPATTLANSCYQQMFYGCTGLTSIPSTLLPATTLAQYCYSNMFYGCTRLTSIPTGLLPATTLSAYCYASMFSKCSGLTAIPSDLLTATTLEDYCYKNMFYGCESLTTAPDLPATTLTTSCYDSMFYGCTNLNSIRMLATNISSTSTYLKSWVYGVASSGTFYKKSGVTIPRGMSGIPSGWTVVNE